MTSPDCAATSFRPAYAITMWVDTRYVYCEIPAKDPANPPLVMKYAKTEGGLTKALSLMATRAAEAGPSGLHYIEPATKITKASTFTEDQRVKARDVLRKMGLI